MIPLVASSKVNIMPASSHPRAVQVSVEYNIPSKTNKAHHTSGVTVESNHTAPAAATGDGARLGASDVPSTPAAAGGESSTPSGQDSHADGTPDETTKDSSAAHSDAAGTDKVVYNEKDELKATTDGRVWKITKVTDNNVHLTAPAKKADGRLHPKKMEKIELYFADIPGNYDHHPAVPEPVLCGDNTEPPNKRQRLDTTAQAEEKIYQAPAALSTRPVPSPAVLSNSANAAASTAVAKLFVMPENSTVQWDGGEDKQGAGKWIIDRDTSLHPFWAVRRITASTLAMEHSANMKKGIPVQRFNCALKDIHVNQNVGSTIGDTARLDRRQCTLCAIYNTEHILKGTELLLNIPEPVVSDDKAEPPSKEPAAT